MNGSKRRSNPIAPSVLALVLALAGAMPLAGQTDYYNTDKNRPVRVEDAYATERYALEAKLAPLRLERATGGRYQWGIHPEIAYGILPRTSVEVGLPIDIIEAFDGSGASAGLAGVDLSVFHNLNRETRTVPALAVRGDLALPVGRWGPDRVRPSVTGILTRTFPLARFHLNAGWSFGPDAQPDEELAHLGERWFAGVAVDRSDPLRALLYTGSVHAERSIVPGGEVEWNVTGGARYQVSPYLALDAGVGRRLTGEAAWFVTFGSAIHIGFRPLIPGVR
jgi:hypothetical protein